MAPIRHSKHGASARNRVKPAVAAQADVRRQPAPRSRTRGGSQATSVTSRPILDDETNADETFMTSTTDYLNGGKEARSRNLQGSFDSEGSSNSPVGRRFKRFDNFGLAAARERKRQNEREWEQDRKSRNARGGKPQTTSNYAQGDDRYLLEMMDSPKRSQSSQQLGNRNFLHDPTGRMGYDSDTTSTKARRSDKKCASRRSLLEETTEGMEATYADSTVHDDRAGRNSAASYGTSFMADSACKIKMTKMEKIKQLQEKNVKYKVEYKKTYLEKKEYKKKYEDKKMEVASLNSEIESYMRETALLKQHLSVLTSDMDHAEGANRSDMSLATKLQKELQLTRADLKAALGRLADRKMESTKLNEKIAQKDEQIESLTLEVSTLIQQIQNYQAQATVQDMASTGSVSSHTGPSPPPSEQMKELQNENDALKAELDVTLTRAADMVKNREHTIELLRKENFELKELMNIRDIDDDRSTASEKIRAKENAIDALRKEIDALKEVCEMGEQERVELKDVIKLRNAEMRHLQGEIDGLKKMVKRAERDVQTAEEEVLDREQTIAGLREKVSNLENQKLGAEYEIEKVSSAVESHEEQMRRLEEELKSLKQEKRDSAKDLDEAREALEENEKEIKALFRENENLRAEMLEQKEELEERRKRVSLELEELKITEQTLNEEARAASKKIKARDEAIEDLLKEIEVLKNSRNHKDTNYSKQIEKQEARIKELIVEVEDLKEQVLHRDQDLKQTKNMVNDREVAIQDLLGDIDALRAKGTEGENEIADRMEKLRDEINEHVEQIERLQNEQDNMTVRLDETENKLAAKTDSLREREEEVEALLSEISEMREHHRHKMQERYSRDHAVEATEKLQQELSNTQELLKSKDEELRKLVQENMHLKDKLDNMEQAVAVKDGDGDADADADADEQDENDTENGETRSYLVAQHEVLEEEIQQLNDQVNDLQEEIDEMHRRNAILNEEVEDWQHRGENFELEIQKLKDKIEEYEDLTDDGGAPGIHGYDGDMDGHSTGEMGDKQAEFLEKAMSERLRRKGGDGNGKGVWGLIFNKSEDENLTDEQKRIKELEAIKDAQAVEIQKIKSDLVKLTTNSRTQEYTTRKRIEELELENDAYKAKVQILLKRLSETQGVPFGDDNESVEEKKLEEP